MKYLKAIRFHLAGLLIILAVIDIFIDSKISNLLVFLVSALWVVTMINYQLKTKIIAVLFSVIIAMAYLSNLVGKELWAEKLTSYFFILFLTVSIYQLFNLKDEK